MTNRSLKKISQKDTLKNLKKEITRLERELTLTRNALEAITTGKADAVVGPACPYVIKAKEAEDAIKNLLQEKDVLIKEIHHRVKNNLQIILSLVHLQLGHNPAPETRENLITLQNRIRAMALVHDMFYRTENMSSLNLAEYLERMAVHLFNIYKIDENRIKLVTELEPIQVSVNVAIPLGLIVNELVSNSIKHAFKNTPGVISLRLRRLEDDHNQLRIEDDGQGLPETVNWKAPTTLGLEIVRLLCQQIEARIELLPGPGTRFVLTFKRFLT